MSWGAGTKYSVAIASATTTSAELDLGRAWKRIYLDMTGANAEVRLLGSIESGGTFRTVYHPSINSATVGNNIFKIGSAVSGGISEIPGGLRYMKIITTDAVANGVTMTLYCSDS